MLAKRENILLQSIWSLQDATDRYYLCAVTMGCNLLTVDSPLSPSTLRSQQKDKEKKNPTWEKLKDSVMKKYGNTYGQVRWCISL